MKTPVSFRVSVAFLAVCLVQALVLAVSVHAATVLVDWGGNYVSSTEMYSNTEFPTDFRAETLSGQGYSTVRGPVLGYSGTVANLTPGGGYTAPSGKSSTFYGGWSASSGTGPAVPGGASGTQSGLSSRSVLQNGAGGQPGEDIMYLALDTPAPAFRGLFVFEKNDFLNGMDAGTVAFDASSELSFTGLVGGYRPILRWVVLDGSTWYISDASFTGTGSFLFWGAAVSSTLSDPNSQLWASYVPIESDSAGPYLYNAAPASGYAAHSFSNVQAVGVYFDSYGVSVTDGTFTNVGLQNFSVTGVAVPEPSTLAFAAIGIAVIGVGLRRKKVVARVAA